MTFVLSASLGCAPVVPVLLLTLGLGTMNPSEVTKKSGIWGRENLHPAVVSGGIVNLSGWFHCVCHWWSS